MCGGMDRWSLGATAMYLHYTLTRCNIRRTDKREFLLLAQTFDAAKHSPAGMYASEKLDGMRLLWDGGLTTGLLASTVPFANTHKDKKEVVCTGLWSRKGKVVWAPKSWTDKLPRMFLDGEGYHGKFQRGQSILRTEGGNSEAWKDIKYKIFDSPPLEALATPGRIHESGGWETRFDSSLLTWLRERQKISPLTSVTYNRTGFGQVYEALVKALGCGDSQLSVLEQTLLPFTTDLALAKLTELMGQIVGNGGEGVMLRNPSSCWEPHRSWDLLKVKKWEDAEGVVIGYKSGKITEKDSRNRGRMGSLIIKSIVGGRELEFGISGFEDHERDFSYEQAGHAAYDYAWNNPDKIMPDWIVNPSFPLGAIVTYTYPTGLTDDGIPKHANYLRKRED